jgi:hypothetical protein
MKNLKALAVCVENESQMQTLAKLLRLTQRESELLICLFKAGETGLTPFQLRQMAPSVGHPSETARCLNRKLTNSGLGSLRVINSCQRMGPGRQLSVYRLIEELIEKT